MIVTHPKRLLLRWVGWFFFANILLCILVQASYLLVLPSLRFVYDATLGSITLAYFFLATSYVAHAAIINGIVAVPVLLLAWVVPRKRLVISVALLLAFAVIMTTVIDRFAYRLYHSHQFSVGLSVLKSGAVGQVIPLSHLEYLFFTLTILLILLIECCIAWRIWKSLSKNAYQNPGKSGYIASAVLGVCVCVSYMMMAFVVSVPDHYRFNDQHSHLLLKMARLVPYYQIVYDWFMPHDSPYYRVWHTDDGQAVAVQTAQPTKRLDYPLHPLMCLPPKRKPNIVFLVFDTLRYDALTPRIMPNMSRFAKNTIRFDDVYSGGNCTQPGIFSLFYGIPANYWNSTVSQRKGPVLIDQLNKAGYQMGIFASASLLFPQFEDNVFVNVKHYRVDTPGDSSMARDKQITQLFSQFVQKRNQHKPFFSFIFYDSVHNYCEGSSQEFMVPFKPAVAECARFSLTNRSDAIPYDNRYHNAAYFLDQQAEKVLQVLRQHHVMKNTIIVVTADHGEQHNDQHMDYWSHASAYTPYQLHIPLLIYWPGMRAQRRNYFVTNMDVAPTLLRRVLNCTNPLDDYTVGKSLFSSVQRPYLISGSYTDYAYVTRNQTIRVYPGGDYVINGPLGHQQYRAKLNLTLLKQASQELNRYYH